METRTHYLIDRNADQYSGHDVYRVWLRTAADPEGTMLGEYDSLDAAKASERVDWRDSPAENVEAWGFGEEIVAEPDEEYPRA